MKVQEVILKAMAGSSKWWEAAEIIGVSDRTMRRWRERYQKHDELARRVGRIEIPAGYLGAQEPVTLNRQYVTLLESQPSLADATLITRP